MPIQNFYNQDIVVSQTSKDRFGKELDIDKKTYRARVKPVSTFTLGNYPGFSRLQTVYTSEKSIKEGDNVFIDNVAYSVVTKSILVDGAGKYHHSKLIVGAGK